MTVREVADELGLQVRTIRAWIEWGIIDAQKVGGRLVISRENIMSREVQERADKARKHSVRIKGRQSMGVLAGKGEDTKESV